MYRVNVHTRLFPAKFVSQVLSKLRDKFARNKRVYTSIWEYRVCTNFETFQKFSVKIKFFLHILNVPIMYSNVPNKRACTFISGKVCLLGSIKVKRQTLPEINMHAHLFGTLEYV